MTNILLAWQSQPQPSGTNLYPDELVDAQTVVRLFKEASRFRAQVTAQGWRFLWNQYGLKGLIEINREAGWFETQDEVEAAEQLVSRSLIAGYDPVSRTFRGYIESIVWHGHPAHA